MFDVLFQGTVPDDLDLLDTEVTKIQRDVAAFHNAKVCEYDPKRASIASENSMQSSKDTLYSTIYIT